MSVGLPTHPTPCGGGGGAEGGEAAPYGLHPIPNAHILRPTPDTRLPTLYTLHLTPYTLHPTPYTLHPTPYTLHLTPYTLHPTPYTLHPAPCTLHPTPTPTPKQQAFYNNPILKYRGIQGIYMRICMHM